MPSPGTRSPRGWLPRLAAKRAAINLGHWLTHLFGQPALVFAPPLPRLTRQCAPPVPSGEEKGATRLYRVCGVMLERLIFKHCSSLTNTSKKYRGGVSDLNAIKSIPY